MKKLKKLAAFLLCAAMILAMGITTFAADENASLTVKVNADNTLKGQELSVYKLFDVTVTSGTYSYVVNNDYKSAIATALGKDPGAETNELVQALAAMVTGSPGLQKFADDFTAAALEGSLNATAKSGKLGDVTEFTFNNLDYGYYLVYQTGTKELQSSLVLLSNATGTTVELKGEAPSITKTADADTVEIGQIVKYTVTGTIPDTTGYAGYQYIIHDTLTAGLDFVNDENGATVAGNDLTVTVQIGTALAEEQTAKLSGANNRTMDLDLSAWIISKQADKGSTFTVTYYAKVNGDAVVQTNNSASLEYGNDPGNTTATTPVKAETPTYPLDIRKTIKGEDMLLEGAKFRLYRNETDATTPANKDNAIKVTGGSGSYIVSDNQTTGNMDMETAAAEVAPGYNLHLNGLAAGDYWLVETDAPAGYNKLSAPIKVTITKTGELTWTVAKNGTDEQDKVIDIENSKGTGLPETGGVGTIIFTVAGAVLVIGVAVSFAVSRKNAGAAGRRHGRPGRRK